MAPENPEKSPRGGGKKPLSESGLARGGHASRRLGEARKLPDRDATRSDRDAQEGTTPKEDMEHSESLDEKEVLLAQSETFDRLLTSLGVVDQNDRLSGFKKVSEKDKMRVASKIFLGAQEIFDLPRTTSSEDANSLFTSFGTLCSSVFSNNQRYFPDILARAHNAINDVADYLYDLDPPVVLQEERETTGVEADESLSDSQEDQEEEKEQEVSPDSDVPPFSAADDSRVWYKYNHKEGRWYRSEDRGKGWFWLSKESIAEEALQAWLKTQEETPEAEEKGQEVSPDADVQPFSSEDDSRVWYKYNHEEGKWYKSEDRGKGWLSKESIAEEALQAWLKTQEETPEVDKGAEEKGQEVEDHPDEETLEEKEESKDGEDDSSHLDEEKDGPEKKEVYDKESFLQLLGRVDRFRHSFDSRYKEKKGYEYSFEKNDSISKIKEEHRHEIAHWFFDNAPGFFLDAWERDFSGVRRKYKFLAKRLHPDGYKDEVLDVDEDDKKRVQSVFQFMVSAHDFLMKFPQMKSPQEEHMASGDSGPNKKTPEADNSGPDDKKPKSDNSSPDDKKPKPVLGQDFDPLADASVPISESLHGYFDEEILQYIENADDVAVEELRRRVVEGYAHVLASIKKEDKQQIEDYLSRDGKGAKRWLPLKISSSYSIQFEYGDRPAVSRSINKDQHAYCVNHRLFSLLQKYRRDKFYQPFAERVVATDAVFDYLHGTTPFDPFDDKGKRYHKSDFDASLDSEPPFLRRDGTREMFSSAGVTFDTLQEMYGSFVHSLGERSDASGGADLSREEVLEVQKMVLESFHQESRGRLLEDAESFQRVFDSLELDLVDEKVRQAEMVREQKRKDSVFRLWGDRVVQLLESSVFGKSRLGISLASTGVIAFSALLGASGVIPAALTLAYGAKFALSITSIASAPSLGRRFMAWKAKRGLEKRADQLFGAIDSGKFPAIGTVVTLRKEFQELMLLYDDWKTDMSKDDRFRASYERIDKEYWKLFSHGVVSEYGYPSSEGGGPDPEEKFRAISDSLAEELVENEREAVEKIRKHDIHRKRAMWAAGIGTGALVFAGDVWHSLAGEDTPPVSTTTVSDAGADGGGGGGGRVPEVPPTFESGPSEIYEVVRGDTFWNDVLGNVADFDGRFLSAGQKAELLQKVEALSDADERLFAREIGVSSGDLSRLTPGDRIDITAIEHFIAGDIDLSELQDVTRDTTIDSSFSSDADDVAYGDISSGKYQSLSSALSDTWRSVSGSESRDFGDFFDSLEKQPMLLEHLGFGDDLDRVTPSDLDDLLEDDHALDEWQMLMKDFVLDGKLDENDYISDPVDTPDESPSGEGPSDDSTPTSYSIKDFNDIPDKDRVAFLESHLSEDSDPRSAQETIARFAETDKVNFSLDQAKVFIEKGHGSLLFDNLDAVAEGDKVGFLEEYFSKEGQSVSLTPEFIDDTLFDGNTRIQLIGCGGVEELSGTVLRDWLSIGRGGIYSLLDGASVSIVPGSPVEAMVKLSEASEAANEFRFDGVSMRKIFDHGLGNLAGDFDVDFDGESGESSNPSRGVEAIGHRISDGLDFATAHYHGDKTLGSLKSHLSSWLAEHASRDLFDALSKGTVYLEFENGVLKIMRSRALWDKELVTVTEDGIGKIASELNSYLK